MMRQQTGQSPPEAVEAACQILQQRADHMRANDAKLREFFGDKRADEALADIAAIDTLIAAVRAGQEAQRTLAEIDQLRSVAKLEVIGGPEHTDCHVIGWFSRPAGLYGAKEAVGPTFTAALRALGAMLEKADGWEASSA